MDRIEDYDWVNLVFVGNKYRPYLTSNGGCRTYFSSRMNIIKARPAYPPLPYPWTKEIPVELLR